MAEILHIQLKIPLHESKREGEEDARARAQERERPSVAAAHLYIYTHHQLTICTYVCRHHCRRTKTNSRPVTLPLSLSRSRALYSPLVSNYRRILTVLLITGLVFFSP